MLLAFVNPQPIDITLIIDGQEFKVVGQSDLEIMTAIASVVPLDLNSTISQLIKTKIERVFGELYIAYKFALSYIQSYSSN